MSVPSASVTSTPSLRESNEARRWHAVRRRRFGLRDQRIDQITVFDHMRERLAGFDIAGERQKHRTGGIVELRIRHDHIRDRLRRRRTCSQIPSASNSRRQAATDRGCARIAARRVPVPDRPRRREYRNRAPDASANASASRKGGRRR